MIKEKAQEVVSKIEKTTLGEICEYIEEIHTKMHSFLGKPIVTFSFRAFRIDNYFSFETGHTAYSAVTIENKCWKCQILNCWIKCSQAEPITNSYQSKSSDNNWGRRT